MIDQNNLQFIKQEGQNMRLNEQTDDESFQDSYGVQLHSDRKIITTQTTQIPQREQKQRKKYGSFLVIYDGRLLITLGPDYWCFLPTFLVFCTVSFFMIRFVFNYSDNIYFQVATVVVCGGMPLSYLLVAISNPGIVTQNQDNTKEQKNPMTKKRLCKICNIQVRRGTYHCQDCDVCIQEHDHHCPWTSKCIGGGNLIRFYLFVAMVPIYLIYVFISFATLMSEITLDSGTAHLQVNTTPKVVY